MTTVHDLHYAVAPEAHFCLRGLGMRVLVTDHHLPGAVLPDAWCIINPNQPGCEFPSKNLAGVGVMFYLMLALRAELRKRGAFAQKPEPNLGALLDLVALGTVADVVKLAGPQSWGGSLAPITQLDTPAARAAGIRLLSVSKVSGPCSMSRITASYPAFASISTMNGEPIIEKAAIKGFGARRRSGKYIITN